MFGSIRNVCDVWKAIAIAAAVPFVVCVVAQLVLQFYFKEALGFRTAATLRRFVPLLVLSLGVLIFAALMLSAACDDL